MIRQLILVVRRRLRVVLPHASWLSGLLLFYLLTDIALVLSNVPLRWGWLPEENVVAAGLMFIAAFFFGAYRVFYFHPFFQWEYGKWLRCSPWIAGRRLPNGPVHLVWQDVLLVGLLAVLSMRSDEFEPLQIPLFLVIPYLLILAMALSFTGEGWVAFLVLLTIGGSLRTLEQPVLAGTCLLVSYVIAVWGLRRSLKRFHEWDLDWWEEKGLTDINAGSLQEKARQKQLGWPFEQLSLKSNDLPISVRVGLAMAILLGWGTHIALYYMDEGGGGPLVWHYRFLLGMPCVFLAFGRAIVYCNGYLPPISFWGRLFTFRWIIPRYDQVFGPSLLIVLVAVFGSSIFASIELPLVYGVPVLLTIMIALAVTMPPSLDDWRLTGSHRVIPQLQNQKAEMVQTQ